GYLLTQRDVLQALRSIRSHLEPGGLFVFEFWQGSAARPAPFKTWLDLRRGQRFLDRFTEIHTIQTYSVPEIRALLRRGKFELLGAFAATNIKKGFGPVMRKTFRVMVVARRSEPSVRCSAPAPREHYIRPCGMRALPRKR